MKITKQQRKEIVHDDTAEFDIVEYGEWIQGGKRQFIEIVFSPKDSPEKFYRLYEDRSGDPFSDWTYGYEYETEDEEAQEVEKTTKTITIWKEK